MSMSPLLQAWRSGPERARRHWENWRATVNLAALNAAECSLLPLLRPRLDEWLAGDPAAPLLLGICKQAWSGNQMRLRQLQQIWQALEARGIHAVVVGRAVSALLTPPPAVLPIHNFELMVALDDVAAAHEESARLGWLPALRTASWTRLADGRGDEWILRWRRFSSAPSQICEVWDMPLRPAPTPWMGTTFTIPSAEWRLRELRLRRQETPSAPVGAAALLRDYRLWRCQRRSRELPRGILTYLRLRWEHPSVIRALLRHLF